MMLGMKNLLEEVLVDVVSWSCSRALLLFFAAVLRGFLETDPLVPWSEDSDILSTHSLVDQWGEECSR